MHCLVDFNSMHRTTEWKFSPGSTDFASPVAKEVGNVCIRRRKIVHTFRYLRDLVEPETCTVCVKKLRIPEEI